MGRVEDAPDKILFPVSIALLVLGVLSAFALLPRIFPSIETAGVGKAAPDVSFRYVLNAPDGRSTAKLSDFLGKPVLIDFWATWCGPCKAEAPIVEKITTRFRDRGLVVVGLNTSDESGDAQGWAQSHGLSYPIAVDEGNAIARAYGVSNLPTLVIVGKDGKVQAVRMGTTSDAELDRLVKNAL